MTDAKKGRISPTMIICTLVKLSMCKSDNIKLIYAEGVKCKPPVKIERNNITITALL